MQNGSCTYTSLVTMCLMAVVRARSAAEAMSANGLARRITAFISHVDRKCVRSDGLRQAWR